MTTATVGCPLCGSYSHTEVECPWWFELSKFCAACPHPSHARRCLRVVSTNRVPMGPGIAAFQSVPCGCDESQPGSQP